MPGTVYAAPSLRKLPATRFSETSSCATDITFEGGRRMRQPGAVQAAAHGPLPMAFAYPHTARRRWRRLCAGAIRCWERLCRRGYFAATKRHGGVSVTRVLSL